MRFYMDALLPRRAALRSWRGYLRDSDLSNSIRMLAVVYVLIRKIAAYPSLAALVGSSVPSGVLGVVYTKLGTMAIVRGLRRRAHVIKRCNTLLLNCQHVHYVVFDLIKVLQMPTLRFIVL